MTKQEAEIWAARLTRIWSREGLAEGTPVWKIVDHRFHFSAGLTLHQHFHLPLQLDFYECYRGQWHVFSLLQK